MSTDEVSTAEGLRAWARGMYPTEAAAELLIRAHGGSFAEKGRPWIEEYGRNRYRIDPEKLYPGYLSGGEQRLLDIVGSLLSDEYHVALGHAISGLDRQTVALVLAALSHASGSQDHAAVGVIHAGDTEETPYGKAGALYPWPEEDV